MAAARGRQWRERLSSTRIRQEWVNGGRLHRRRSRSEPTAEIRAANKLSDLIERVKRVFIPIVIPEAILENGALRPQSRRNASDGNWLQIWHAEKDRRLGFQRIRSPQRG